MKSLKTSELMFHHIFRAKSRLVQSASMDCVKNVLRKINVFTSQQNKNSNHYFQLEAYMKQISVKTFYLIAVISIGLIGLAVGSTYAMFTTSAEINNPITISSNLISNDDVMETFEVEVKSKEFITKTIIVNSGNNTNINYGMRYYCI